MCTIHTETDLKTQTVYKTVTKINGKYYGCFSGIKIETGKVKRQTLKRIHPHLLDVVICFEKGDFYYNSRLVGRCSGFEFYKDAKALCSPNIYGIGTHVVLRIVLGGSIWLGNAENISLYISDSNPVYAGSEVIEFKEL